MTFNVLVVSEDPALIHHAFNTLRPLGMTVTGCLGPALGPCKLEDSDGCGLAAHSDVVLIDSPPSGVFTDHLKRVPAADYAAELADRHPETLPILCGAPEGTSGATGDSTQAPSTIAAIEMLRQLASVTELPDTDFPATHRMKEVGHES
jgi:hypothetical protein